MGHANAPAILVRHNVNGVMQIHQPCWLDIMQWGHAISPAMLVKHNAMGSCKCTSHVG